MEDNRKDCPLRHKRNGNCLPCGGFCTAVNDAICEAIHQAYDHGFSDGYRKAEADASWDTPAFSIGDRHEMGSW